MCLLQRFTSLPVSCKIKHTQSSYQNLFQIYYSLNKLAECIRVDTKSISDSLTASYIIIISLIYPLGCSYQLCHQEYNNISCLYLYITIGLQGLFALKNNIFIFLLVCLYVFHSKMFLLGLKIDYTSVGDSEKKMLGSWEPLGTLQWTSFNAQCT